MLSAKEIGQIGEDIAVKYLKKRGYKIADRNFQADIKGLKFGELDIVAKKDGIIVFVEVKCLKQEVGIAPEERVDFKKRETIGKMAEIWFGRNRIPPDTPWQIDVIAVVLDFNQRKAKIRHFKNI